MTDQRKSIKVSPGVKYELTVLKKHLGLRTESEVILYLQEFYEDRKASQTLVSHNEIKARVEQLHRQQSF